jgi:predicted KAP-like P-loop ATPase
MVELVLTLFLHGLVQQAQAMVDITQAAVVAVRFKQQQELVKAAQAVVVVVVQICKLAQQAQLTQAAVAADQDQVEAQLAQAVLEL